MSDTFLTPEANTRLVIDPIKRTIAPKYRRQKAVYIAKGDHNSVLMAFEIPRYVDGYDMSAKENAIHIHYANVSGEDTTKYSRGFSGAVDVKVEEDEETGEEIVSFCWLVPNTATKYAGTVSIGITFERYDMVDGAMQEIYSWSTAPYGETIVWDSMDNTKDAVEREYNYLIMACNSLVASMLKEAIDSGVLDGTNGIDGKDGKDGKNGVDGKDGADGKDGKDGYSAYEVALKNGFTGTEREWLASLSGDGKNGADGFSPTVAIESVNNGHKVIITDKNGAKSFIVTDGYLVDESVPIALGEGDFSVKVGDLVDNESISDYSVTIGRNVAAGRKAYYIKSIDSTKGKIYLSKTQVTPVFSDADNTDYSFPTPAYSEGDEFSIIVGGGHYILCGVICSVQNNVLSYAERKRRLDGTEEFERYDYKDPVYYWKIPIQNKPSGAFLGFATYDSETPVKSLTLPYGSGGSTYIMAEPSLSGGDYIVISSIDSSDVIKNAFISGYVYAIFEAPSLPITEFKDIDVLEIDDYTLCVPTKPDVGVVTLGVNAICTGCENISAGDYGFASGRGNIVAGNYGTATGRRNRVGYAGFVTGFENIVKDHGSFGAGYNNTLKGSCSQVFGIRNIAEGDNSHTEGYYNTAKGISNHTEGQNNAVNGNVNSVGGANNEVSGENHDVRGKYNVVSGGRNTVRGYKNKASGTHQFVIGQWSKDEPDKAFIIGWGNSEDNRKNIMTVDKNGNVYFAGSLYTDKDDNYLYTFDNYRSIEKFVSESRNLTLSCYDRAMKAVSTGADPIFFRNFGIPLDGTKYPYIKIRYKVPSNLADGRAKIYFATTAYTTISEDRKIEFMLTKDDTWQDIVIDMSVNSYWTNGITMLRFDIPNSSASGITTYFKYIGLFHDSDEANSFFLSNGTSSTSDISLIDLRDSGKLTVYDGAGSATTNYTITKNTISSADGRNIELFLTGQVCVALLIGSDGIDGSATFYVDGQQKTVTTTDQGGVVLFEGYVANSIKAYSTFGNFDFKALKYI